MNMVHGRSQCEICFENNKLSNGKFQQWMITNDPCYWGGPEPEVLVLGFSKGFTQANAINNDLFENIPFKGMRPRLTAALRAFQVLGQNENVDNFMADPKGRIGFASLVRCSVARIDEKQSVKAGRSVYGCTGPIIGKSFKEIPHIISNCAKAHLSNLPQSVKLIVILGNGDQYIRESRKVISQLFPFSCSNINEVSMKADGRIWVWLAHPSGLNGHFNNWINGVGKAGQKFHLAQQTLG